MGRRAKPIHLHVVEGNPNRLTKAEIEARMAAEARLRPASDKVRPPTWLGKEAKKIFRRLVKEMEQTELWTNVDVDTLAVYCDAVVRYAQASQDIEENGLTVEGARGVVQNPAVLVASKYASIISRCAAKLGLDPASRASLAIPKEAKKEVPSPVDVMFGNV